MKKALIVAACIALMALLLTALGSGAAGAQHTIIESYQKVSMPDFGQHSANWCWVAAAKNSFWWYSEHGFPQLEDDPEGEPGNQKWKNIDPDSMNPAPDGKDNDGDGHIDEDPYDGVDNDGDGWIDEDGNDWYDSMQDWTYHPDTKVWEYTPVAPVERHGYYKNFRKFAEATYRDKNKNCKQDAGEKNYIYSQPVWKWDYLKGLANFIKIQKAAPGSVGLVVHDIADPVNPVLKIEPPTYPDKPPTGRDDKEDQTPRYPKLGDETVLGTAGIKICFRPPTFFDYARDLRHSEDVLLCMSRGGGIGHVVTGVSYEGKDTNDDGKVDEYWIDFSDPWSHFPATQPGDVPPVDQPGHDCPRPYTPWEPDHNNNPNHDKYPYDKARVVSNNPFVIEWNEKQWRIIDLIFVSPNTPKYRPVKSVTIRGVENTIHTVKVEFTYKTKQNPVIVTELQGRTVSPGQIKKVVLPRGKYAWPDDIHVTYTKNGGASQVRTIPTYLQDRVEDPAPNKKYSLSPDDMELEEEPIPAPATGASTYVLLTLALASIGLGLFMLRRRAIKSYLV